MPSLSAESSGGFIGAHLFGVPVEWETADKFVSVTKQDFAGKVRLNTITFTANEKREAHV